MKPAVTPSSPSLSSRLKQWLEELLFQDPLMQEQKALERYLAQADSLEELERRQRSWERQLRAGR